MPKKLQHLTTNLANLAIRNETLHGRDYLVAPMAMITEGVHKGSGGSLYYPADETERAAPAWNMKPIVVYHPEINGQGCSACDPQILENQQVGMVMNTQWRGKLRAEAWIDKDMANNVDPRVMDALENNKLMEVSTGLYTVNESKAGEFNGKTYTHIARNHAPDHLALLPDRVGACSIADGAGLLQLNEAAEGVAVDRMWQHQFDTLRRMVGNALSHGNLHQMLQKALVADMGTSDDETGGPWVVDVYDNFVIYDQGGKLWRRGFAKSDDAVNLSEVGPDEVKQVTEYRMASDGAFIGNETETPSEKNQMTKTELVAALIANAATVYDQTDEGWLSKLEEPQLLKLGKPVANGGDMSETPDDEEEDEDGKKKKKKPVKNEQAQATPATMEAFLAQAPPEYREVLVNGLNEHTRVKGELVDKIVANKANTFTREFLLNKDVAELRGWAAAMTPAAPPAQPQPGVPMFNGQGTLAQAPVANSSGEPFVQEPLPVPSLSFDD